MRMNPSAIHLDARLSPALSVSPELLRIGPRGRSWPGSREDRPHPLLSDETLRWLAASDRIVSDQAAGALLEVKEAKLHVKEGHARWSTYLRAFVPMTARWCQQEMRRARALRDYPALAAAWAAGVLSKSHLRVVLRAVTPETEEAWLQRAAGATVRELEELANREAEVAACEPYDPEEARLVRRIVMAPPRVAVLVSEAVDVARKMAAYQVGIGAAVEMMSMEMMAGLNEYPISPDPSSHSTECSGLEPPRAGDSPEATLPEQMRPQEARGIAGVPAIVRHALLRAERAAASEPHAGGQATPTEEPQGSDDAPGRCETSRRRRVSLGDHPDLRREMGAGWERIHQQMEAATGRWRDLPADLHQVLIHGAPAEDAGAHERVVFWTGLQGRLDAVRGRLLRIVEEGYLSRSLGFAGFGQYVRERMGLSLRDAHELVRLDKALERLPVAFHSYASGRLGRRAAWLISRVATSQTDKAWARFAMTHTLRLLEVVVEGSLLKREADPQAWERDRGLPPQDVTFASALRACSLLKDLAPGGDATARVEFLLDPEQLACYEATLKRIREVSGLDRPEWWGLAVMAQYFLDCYGDEDRLASPARLRRMFHRLVIERDNYTCRAPECMQRGGLEADHMKLRSVGGQTTHENMIALCAADHRFMKHTAGTLSLSGMAPDHVTVRMGSRVYLNDHLIEPALDEAVLDEDPWKAALDEALPNEAPGWTGCISIEKHAVAVESGSAATR